MISRDGTFTPVVLTRMALTVVGCALAGAVIAWMVVAR